MAKLICILRSTYPQVQPDIFKCSNCGCDEVRPRWKYCCNCGEQLTEIFYPSKNEYDFSGYVTKYNVLCSDGRTIAPEAFMDCDGITVPLLSNLCEITIDNVIGSITLQHRSDGVYGYGQFNNSQLAKAYQEEVNLSCIRDLCIYANKLKETDHIVTFGVIRAVSISSSGANPEAYIDCIINKDKEVQNEHL